MDYPNLRSAMRLRRMAQFHLAQLIGLSESGFSRRVTGRVPFTDSEKQRIAGALGYPLGWLFRKAKLPEPQA